MHTEEPLTEKQIDTFVRNGFVKLERAVPRALAEECQDLIWTRLGCDRDDPKTWTKPVLRQAAWDTEAFARAANRPVLHAAFDQLVGSGRWLTKPYLGGAFVVRFPSTVDPGDAGWHIDGSFPVGDWRFVNYRSRGRALLTLFLFSDVRPEDAPTRLYAGSHLDVAAALVPYGDAGTHWDSVVSLIPHVHKREVANATGEAGDAYLCHPFLVHAGSWPHRGTRPRFIAQPELPAAAPCELQREDAAYSPVETAIRLGLGL